MEVINIIILVVAIIILCAAYYTLNNTVLKKKKEQLIKEAHVEGENIKKEKIDLVKIILNLDLSK